MDKSLARNFSYELEAHPFVQLRDREKLIKFLTAVDVPLINAQEPSRAYETLPENGFRAEGYDGKDTYLSLRRVLRNRVVQLAEPTISDEIYRRLVSGLRIRDSNLFVQRVLQDRGIVNLMKACGSPFSLSGYVVECKPKTDTLPEKSQTRPILVIPSTKGIRDVLDLEQAHTIYEKTVGILFSRQKRISQEEYASYK